MVNVEPARLAKTIEGKLDSPILEEGDNAFIGFATRPHPTSLTEGIAQEVLNGRLDRGTFKTRAGIKQVSANVILTSPPLIVDADTDVALDRLLLSPVSVSSLSRVGATATCVTAAVHNMVTGQTAEIAGCTNNTNFNGDFVVTVTNTTTFTYTMTDAGATTASGTMTSTHRWILKNNYNDGVFSSGIWSDPSRTAHNREYIALVTGSKVFFYSERDENLSLLQEVEYGGEAIKQVDEVSVLQAFQRFLVFRGATRNKPIMEWTGDFASTFTNKATTGAVDLNCPAASYGTFFRNRLIVPREIHNMTVPASAGITQLSGTTYVVNTTTPHNIYDKEVIQITTSSGGNFDRDYTATKITGKLDGTITASASVTTITLASTTGFPTAGTNYISVEGEVMTYTGVSGANLTGVSRGAYAEAHGNQAEVELLTGFKITHVNSSDGADTSGNAIVIKRVRDEVFASDILDTDNFNPFGLFRISKGTNDRVVAFHPYDSDSLIVFCRHSIHRIIGLTDVDTATIELITDEVGCVAPRSVQRVGSDIFFLAHNGLHSLKMVGSNLRLMGANMPLSEPIHPTIKTINMDWAEDRQQGVVAIYHDNRYWLAYATGKGADVRITPQSAGAVSSGSFAILNGGSGYKPSNGQISLKITGGNGNGEALAHANVVDGVITSIEVTAGGAGYDGTERVQVPARNHKILIFNILNKQWESIDSYTSDEVFLDNFVRMTWQGEIRLFATSFEGGIYLLEEGTTDQFGMAGGGSLSSTEIQSQLKTRQYLFGRVGMKKYIRAQIESNFPSGTGTFTMTPASENTDQTGETTSISSAQSGENDLTSRLRLGRLRGRSLEFTFVGTSGQPEIRGVAAEATITSRMTTSYE